MAKQKRSAQKFVFWGLIVSLLLGLALPARIVFAQTTAPEVPVIVTRVDGDEVSAEAADAPEGINFFRVFDGTREIGGGSQGTAGEILAGREVKVTWSTSLGAGAKVYLRCDQGGPSSNSLSGTVYKTWSQAVGLVLCTLEWGDNEEQGRKEYRYFRITQPATATATPTATRTPVPTSTNVPTATAVPLQNPMGLQYQCLANGEVQLTWDSVSGATRYAWRVDDSAPSWNPCNSPDQCGEITATTVTISVRPTVRNDMWVHAIRGSEWSAGSSILQFTCAAPTHTPVPTPKPTDAPTATASNTPVPTNTSVPTATAVPTEIPEAPDTTMREMTPGLLVRDDLVKVCFNTYMASIATSNAAVSIASFDATKSSAPLRALRNCIEPSTQNVGMPAPTFCPNKKRVIVIKDALDSESGWAIEYRCDQTTGPVMLGTTGTLSIGPGAIVGGIISLALATVWATQPTTVEMVWIPAGEVTANAGTMIAQSLEEAEDFLLSLAVKPATANFGAPVTYEQFFDGDSLAGSLRLYSAEAEVWSKMVKVVEANTGVDNETVAMLQVINPGATGAILHSVLFKTADDESGSTLWEAVAKVMAEGYEIPDLLPGVAERTGVHSNEGNPLLTAKKNSWWNKISNTMKAWTLAGFLPPIWDWCGFRPSDGACSCVCYPCEIARMVVDAVTGVVTMKSEKGGAIIKNSNSTTFGGLKPLDPAAARFSEGLRPKGAQWEPSIWDTLDPTNPAHKERVDQCQGDLGLKLPIPAR